MSHDLEVFLDEGANVYLPETRKIVYFAYEYFFQPEGKPLADCFEAFKDGEGPVRSFVDNLDKLYWFIVHRERGRFKPNSYELLIGAHPLAKETTILKNLISTDHLIIDFLLENVTATLFLPTKQPAYQWDANGVWKGETESRNDLPRLVYKGKTKYLNRIDNPDFTHPFLEL